MKIMKKFNMSITGAICWEYGCKNIRIVNEGLCNKHFVEWKKEVKEYFDKKKKVVS